MPNPPSNAIPCVAVIGDFNIDVILGGVDRLPRLGYDTVSPDYTIEPGGSAGIVGLGLARVGLETELHATIGTDLFARFLRESAEEAGLRLVGAPASAGAPTGLSVAFSKNNDRGFISVPNPVSDWSTLDDIEADHIHICYHPYLPGLTRKLAELVPAWRAAGRTVSLDPAGPGPKAGFDRLAALQALGRVDFLFLNTQELGEFGLEEPPAAWYFDDLADTIIVKRGYRGAAAYARDVSMELPEHPVHAIEWTGAGDNFAVGFLTSWLRRRDLETAVRAGNVFGAESTRYPGGVQVQTRFQALLQRHPALFG